MKKIFFILVSVLTIMACSTSIEKRIKNNAYEELKGDSSTPFDTLSVVIDTSFVVYNSDLRIAMMGISDEIQDIEFEQSLIELYRSNQIYSMYSKKVDELNAKVKNMLKEKENVEKIIREEKNKGVAKYKVTIKYRRGVDEYSSILYYDKEGNMLKKISEDYDYSKDKEVLEKWGYKI